MAGGKWETRSVFQGGEATVFSTAFGRGKLFGRPRPVPQRAVRTHRVVVHPPGLDHLPCMSEILHGNSASASFNTPTICSSLKRLPFMALLLSWFYTRRSYVLAGLNFGEHVTLMQGTSVEMANRIRTTHRATPHHVSRSISHSSWAGVTDYAKMQNVIASASRGVRCRRPALAWNIR